jgi:Regulator of chromosome condensation (RCC1) repeat
MDKDKEKDKDKVKEKEKSNLTVKSVACGDFHSAALTHSGRLYVWGACAVPVSGVDSLSQLSPTPVTDPCSPKVDVTSSLGGVPTKVTALYSTILHCITLHYTALLSIPMTGCVLLYLISNLLHPLGDCRTMRMCVIHGHLDQSILLLPYMHFLCVALPQHFLNVVLYSHQSNFSSIPPAL